MELNNSRRCCDNCKHFDWSANTCTLQDVTRDFRSICDQHEFPKRSASLIDNKQLNNSTN